MSADKPQDSAEDPPGKEVDTALRWPQTSPRQAMLIAATVTACTSVAITIAFNPVHAGSYIVLLSMFVNYAVLTTVTLVWLRRRGELWRTMRPAFGDLAGGAFVAAILYGAAMGTRVLLTPHGSPREAWLMRLYLQIGDPNADDMILVGGGVFVVAALEEIVWRGFVMRALEGPWGRGKAWVISSLLFAIAHLPTIFLLGDPYSGLNPLVVIAAFGCSMVWGRLVHLTGRLMPSLFAHALFSWAIVNFPIWRP